MVHRQDCPNPRSHAPLRNLSVPPALEHFETNWRNLPLSRNEEDVKELAVKAYVIPRMVKDSFVQSFVRRNEIFGVADPVKPKRIGSTRPVFTLARMPYVIERDPASDGLRPPTSGDLRTVSVGIGDSRVYMAVETAGRIPGNLTYEFRMRVFKGKTVDRYDIGVRNGRASCQRLASNSVVLKGRIPVGVRANRLWIYLPGPVFDGAGTCLMSVDCMDGPSRLDRTAWRRLVI